MIGIEWEGVRKGGVGGIGAIVRTGPLTSVKKNGGYNSYYTLIQMYQKHCVEVI